MRKLKRSAVVLALLLFLAMAPATPVSAGQSPTPAAIFSVTTLDDSGPGSLRQAIEDANALAAADMRIQFDEGLAGGRVLLQSELPVIGVAMTIAGPSGGVEIAMDAGISTGGRHFRMGNDSAPLFDVTLQGLTLTGPGEAAALPGGENGGIQCGGAGDAGRGSYDISPYFDGSLTLIGCVVRKCVDDTSASFLQAGGGGVSMLSLVSTLVLRGCTLQDNRALGLGGGVLAVGDLRADNSTLQNCRARMHGGAVMCVGSAELYACTLEKNEASETGGGGLFGSARMVNCTLAGNICGENGGGLKAASAQLQHCTLSGNRMLVLGQGGAGVDASGSLVMDGTIVSGNYDAGGYLCEVSVGLTPDIYSGTGAVEDLYGLRNLIGVPGASRFVKPTLAGLQTVMAAQTDTLGSPVGAVADNGGTVRTILLTAGGPAINAVPKGLSPYAYPARDARGVARPQSAAYDIGAVEFRLIVQIVISPGGVTLPQGGQQVLLATVLPDVTDGPRTLQWTSSAPAVATVDQNGRVRAISPGTATITCSAQDGSGVTASITVTVVQSGSSSGSPSSESSSPSSNGGGGNGGGTGSSGASSRSRGPSSSAYSGRTSGSSNTGSSAVVSANTGENSSAESSSQEFVVVAVQRTDGGGGFAWWVLVVGGILLLLLAALLFFLFKRRRRDEDEDEYDGLE